MNIVLCGLPFSGKTTLGKKIAEKLAFDFIDVDDLIETASKKRCRALFKEEGETVFRQIEKEQIFSLIGKQSTVISTGGGAVSDLENRTFLKNLGLVIYLKRDPEMLLERMTELPSYLESKEAFYKLAEKRAPFYESAADVITETEEELWQAIHLALSSK